MSSKLIINNQHQNTFKFIYMKTIQSKWSKWLKNGKRCKITDDKAHMNLSWCFLKRCIQFRVRSQHPSRFSSMSHFDCESWIINWLLEPKVKDCLTSSASCGGMITQHLTDLHVILEGWRSVRTTEILESSSSKNHKHSAPNVFNKIWIKVWII